MSDKKIKEAIDYATASNKIESLDTTKEELENLKAALINRRSDESFLYSLVKKIKDSEKNNDKTR